MSESDLRTLLEDRLAAVEPPLRLTTAETIRDGRRARRRRRSLVAGLASVAVAGAVAVVVTAGLPTAPSTVATDEAPAGSGDAPVAVDVAIEGVVAAQYAPHLGPLPDEPVTATNDRGETVALGAPGVTGIGVQYELPGEHTVTLGLHAADPTAVTDCAQWERDGTAVRCEVRSLSDGGRMMLSVLAFGPAEPVEPELPTILTADQIAAADPATLTWSHGVLVRTPDGEISGAYEVLPAPSYAAARAAWQLPDDAMIAATTDPALTGHDFG